MNAAEPIAPTITEPLTWEQIGARYPDQWVGLVEICRIHPNGVDIRSARVISHGQTRQQSLIQARPWRARRLTIGHVFTGPDDDTPLPRFYVEYEDRNSIQSSAEPHPRRG